MSRALSIAIIAMTTLVVERASAAEPCMNERGTVVDVLDVRGLGRTERYVVEREVLLRPLPARLSVAEWSLVEARLWNLGIFSRVRLEATRNGDGACAMVVDVEERFTLNPLLRYAIGGRALMFGLGAEDNNLFGRYLTGSVLYEYFDGFHGGEVTFVQPRLFDQRKELLLQAGRLVRPRPGFADARAGGRIDLAASSEDDMFRGVLRLEGFADRFLEPLEGPRRFPAAETESLALSPVLRVGRVDTVRIRQKGASLELTPTGARLFSDANIGAYGQMRGEALVFVTAGERWNFAARFRAAVTSEVPDHLALWVGGLDLLRGFPDNHFRSTAYALGNAEIRFTAFDSTWFALVPAVFADAAAARIQEGRRAGDVSVGGGIRLLVPKLVGTGLRFDCALPVTADGPLVPQASLGVYQFFFAGMPASKW